MGIDSLSLEGGGTIEELDLDFSLPGYPDNELKVRVYRRITPLVRHSSLLGTPHC